MGSSSPLRKDIEGLRALAILMVVAYHAHVPGFSGGFVGVDVFFVLSGYLITQLLLNEIAATGTINILQFYARRARRLLPAMGVLLLAVILGSAMLFAPFEQRELATSALATSSYVSNVYFARSATDYHSPTAQTNPLLHTWSLSVEEQFYAVWPLLMLVASRRSRSRGRSSIPSLMVVLSILLALSLTLSLVLTSSRQPWAFFLAPPRAWEFALGAAGTLVPGFDRSNWARRLEDRYSSAGAVLRGVRAAAGWIGLFGVVVSGVLFDENTVFPGLAAMLPAIGTLLVLRAGAGNDPVGPGVLNLRGFQELGRLSYSWYLWHWPLLVFGAAMVPDLGLLGRIILVLVALAIAELSFRLVEHPIRSNRALVVRPALALYVAGAITVGGVLASIAWLATSGRWATNASQTRFGEARADRPVIYSMGCDEWFYSSVLRECAFGARGSRRTVVLLGDSHSGQWFPAVEAAFVPQGWRLIVMTKSGCPAVDAPFVYDRIGRVYSECDEWRRNALERIAKLKPELVVVSSFSGYPLGKDDFLAGTDRVWSSLGGSSRHVAVIADTIGPGFDLPTCLARLSWRPSFVSGPDCSDFQDSASRQEIQELQSAVAARLDNVRIIDMNGLIATGGGIGGASGSTIRFRDASHLTANFARSLSTSLIRELDAEFEGELALDEAP